MYIQRMVCDTGRWLGPCSTHPIGCSLQRLSFCFTVKELIVWHSRTKCCLWRDWSSTLSVCEHQFSIITSRDGKVGLFNKTQHSFGNFFGTWQCLICYRHSYCLYQKLLRFDTHFHHMFSYMPGSHTRSAAVSVTLRPIRVGLTRHCKDSVSVSSIGNPVCFVFFMSHWQGGIHATVLW